MKLKARNKAADTYRDKAAAYVKANGAGVTIHRDQHRSEWVHWEDYFDHIGMGWSAREMRSMGTDSFIVPCMSPLEFDHDVAMAAVGRGDARRISKREKPDTGARRALLDRLQGTLSQIEEFR